MLLIVDTNIIISCLIKDSKTREILMTANIDFAVPEWVHSEIRKHMKLIAKKADVSVIELEHFMEELFQGVHTTPFEEYQANIDEAHKLIGEVDKDDVPFIALALALHADAIWTNDKDFDEQFQVAVLKTHELLEML